MSTTLSKSEALLKAVEIRRTHYNLTNKSSISNEAIKAIVERAVKHAPTSFNMQDSRAVIATGDKHQKLWDVVTETHLKTLGGNKEQEAFWKNKIDTSYRTGYGTVLFFSDEQVIKDWSAKFPFAATLIPKFSDNGAGMLQFIVWAALKEEGLGASLQHYGGGNPETEVGIQKLFDLPGLWRSTALMPFGVPAGPPAPREYQPLEDRVKTFFD